MATASDFQLHLRSYVRTGHQQEVHSQAIERLVGVDLMAKITTKRFIYILENFQCGELRKYVVNAFI